MYKSKATNTTPYHIKHGNFSPKQSKLGLRSNGYLGMHIEMLSLSIWVAVPTIGLPELP